MIIDDDMGLYPEFLEEHLRAAAFLTLLCRRVGEDQATGDMEVRAVI